MSTKMYVLQTDRETGDQRTCIMQKNSLQSKIHNNKTKLSGRGTHSQGMHVKLNHRLIGQVKTVFARATTWHKIQG